MFSMPMTEQFYQFVFKVRQYGSFHQPRGILVTQLDFLYLKAWHSNLKRIAEHVENDGKGYVAFALTKLVDHTFGTLHRAFNNYHFVALADVGSKKISLTDLKIHLAYCVTKEIHLEVRYLDAQSIRILHDTYRHLQAPIPRKAEYSVYQRVLTINEHEAAQIVPERCTIKPRLILSISPRNCRWG